MANKKNKKSSEKPLTETVGADKLVKYANASYFKKKDKMAAEFLQKHPIPSKFLK